MPFQFMGPAMAASPGARQGFDEGFAEGQEDPRARALGAKAGRIAQSGAVPITQPAAMMGVGPGASAPPQAPPSAALLGPVVGQTAQMISGLLSPTALRGQQASAASQADTQRMNNAQARSAGMLSGNQQMAFKNLMKDFSIA